MATAFVTGPKASAEFEHNLKLALGQITASAQQNILLMEIARSLDLIAQSKTPTVYHVGHASAD